MSDRPTAVKRGWRKGLDVVTNVLTIVVCVVTAYFVWSSKTNHGATGSPEPAVRPGQTVAEAVPSFDFRKSKLTLVISLRSTCGYCTQSLPFVRALSESPVLRREAIQILAVSPETEQSLQSYLSAHAVVVPAVKHVEPTALLARYTPTIAVVDSLGRVRRVWTGRIDDVMFGQIMAALAPKGVL